MTQYVFDSGAFIALERRDERVVGLARRLAKKREVIHTTAGVLAQIWRNPVKQHDIAVLLKSGVVSVRPLTETVGKQLGLLLEGTGTSDVVDAHVAFLARQLDAQILTSDPGDFQRIDPALTFITV